MKLLLLDLDGTVRHTKSGATFINDPTDQEVIPEAAKAIARYLSNGWIPIGITNQGGVAAGKKSLEDAIQEQAITLKLLPPEFATIYFCPDYEGDQCWKIESRDMIEVQIDFKLPLYAPFKGLCRKPKPGMIQIALLEFGSSLEVLYIGDRDEDKAAASAADIPFMWHHEWWKIK